MKLARNEGWSQCLPATKSVHVVRTSRRDNIAVVQRIFCSARPTGTAAAAISPRGPMRPPHTPRFAIRSCGGVGPIRPLEPCSKPRGPWPRVCETRRSLRTRDDASVPASPSYRHGRLIESRLASSNQEIRQITHGGSESRSRLEGVGRRGLERSSGAHVPLPRDVPRVSRRLASR